jgi:hypothetical protein
VDYSKLEERVQGVVLFELERRRLHIVAVSFYWSSAQDAIDVVA